MEKIKKMTFKEVKTVIKITVEYLYDTPNVFGTCIYNIEELVEETEVLDSEAYCHMATKHIVSFIKQPCVPLLLSNEYYANVSDVAKRIEELIPSVRKANRLVRTFRSLSCQLYKQNQFRKS